MSARDINSCGDGTYSLGHTNTSVLDRESLVCLVWDDVDPEVFARVELAWVAQSLISDLVESV